MRHVWALLRERHPFVERFAGPALIVGAVLIVLRAYAFEGRLSSTHPDLLPFWYPTFCYLGKSLAHGHIPAWNPHVMGGVPFAADPQSGWMYLPAMLLFSLLPCGLAMSWFIVLQPILAGLGIYGFLRSEGVSTPGATVGGVSLSLAIAASGLAQSMPFAGVLAWTSVMLFAASRLLRSSSWRSRIAWLIATAFAWGQAGAAFMTAGLFVATLTLVLFVATRLTGNLRSGRTPGRRALGLGALVVVALPLLNLAFLLPRLAYLPRTSLSRGYQTLGNLNEDLAGVPRAAAGPGGVPATTVFRFSEPGGVYFGAIALALAFAGWRVRRLWPLVVAFGLLGALSYALEATVVARWIGPGAPRSLIANLYAHAPNRLALGLFVAIPVLAALGVEAWRERAGPTVRAAMIGSAVAVWILVPLAVGLRWQNAVRPAVGAAIALVVLTGAAVRPALIAVIPLALAAELSINALTVSGQPCCPGAPAARPHSIQPLLPPARPQVSAAAYGRAGPIARYIQRDAEGRYISVGPALSRSNAKRAPQNWPFLATQRSMVFGIEEAQGFNPVELVRYWTFVRAVQRTVILYNEAYFVVAKPLALNLFQVAYVVQPSADPKAVPDSQGVATEGSFTLYRLSAPSDRATFVEEWTVTHSAAAALSAILVPGFDPGVAVILEREPRLRVGSAPFPGRRGLARYEALGDQAARVMVEAPTDGLVLVRNSFDRNWHATVDGRPAPVLVADYTIQAVPVPHGRHVVRLRYDDPAVGHGLLGSAITLLGLLFAAGIARFRKT